jgi:Tetratricopeptide repeat
MLRHTMSTWWVLFLLVVPIHAQTTDPGETTNPSQATAYTTGLQTVTFTRRSELSTVQAITARFRAELRQPPEDYRLQDETFALYVPPSYDGTEAFGLIVWINAGPQGRPPKEYLPVLDRRKLIWIGADNSGNPRSFWHRAGLALDGLSNITQSHNIDPDRTYISGISGGGRCSSRMGLTYPDLFAGTFPIIGVDYYTRIRHPNSTDRILRFWEPSFNGPPRKLLRRAKQECRFVLLTGEHDGNKPQTLATYELGLKRAKFEFVTYLEVPGMDHRRPPADWFDRGIQAMDEPIELIRQRREEKAEHDLAAAMDRLARSNKAGTRSLKQLIEDYPRTSAAKKANEELDRVNDPDDAAVQDADEDQSQTPPIDEARETLTLARNYLQAGRTDLARDLLNVVIEHYPDSKEAERARVLLDRMDTTD